VSEIDFGHFQGFELSNQFLFCLTWVLLAKNLYRIEQVPKEGPTPSLHRNPCKLLTPSGLDLGLIYEASSTCLS